MHWLYVFAGLSSGNSPFYLFWSGIGADFTRLALLGALAHLIQRSARHHKELLELHERHHRERRQATRGGSRHI